MTKFDVYCDSGANIPDEIVKQNDIHVVPFVISVNGDETICKTGSEPFAETAKKFYAAMREGAEVKTSLMTCEVIKNALRPSLENGKDVIMFFISSGISGTFNQGKEAQKELSSEFPERKIVVCDSANASMGEGLQVLHAATLRDMGEDVETCAEWVKNNAYKINSYLTVGDLKYLKRTGRISTTLAIAGTLLNIKPILRADGADNAKIVSFDKTRGRKKAISALAEAYSQVAEEPSSHVAAICHADSEDDAKELAELIKARGAKDVIIEYYDLCTGSHVGPGTVALFFYGKDRRSEKKEKHLFHAKKAVQKS